MKKLLLIFAKYPIPGSVKTRLARDIGPSSAARIYRHFVERIIEKFTAIATDFDVHVAVAQHAYLADFQMAFPGAGYCFSQTQDADLGVRMRNAIAKSLEAGYRKVAVIGSDSPHLPAEYVEKAFRKLDKKDVVIGPARDGGYYLIAVKKDLPCLFRNVDWGTARVFQQTQERIAEKRLSLATLPELYDVDVLDDLLRLQKDAPEIFEHFPRESTRWSL